MSDINTGGKETEPAPHPCSSNAESTSAAEGDPGTLERRAWRGPSPGVRGWALHRAGLLGARRAISLVADRATWDARCPLCGSSCIVFGVYPWEVAADGAIFCNTCHEQGMGEPGVRVGYKTVEKAMSDEFYAQFDDDLARILDIPDVEVAFGCWQAELIEVVPSTLDLSMPKALLISRALAALERYGADLEPDPALALPEVAYWRNNSSYAHAPPAWLTKEVQRRIMFNRASLTIRAIFERLTLATERNWFFAHEIWNEERDALLQVAELIGCLDLLAGNAKPGKTLGKLLSRFVPRCGRPSGVLKQVGRGAHGIRWALCRK